jgi:hypothetical protein
LNIFCRVSNTVYLQKLQPKWRQKTQKCCSTNLLLQMWFTFSKFVLVLPLIRGCLLEPLEFLAYIFKSILVSATPKKQKCNIFKIKFSKNVPIQAAHMYPYITPLPWRTVRTLTFTRYMFLSLYRYYLSIYCRVPAALYAYIAVILRSLYCLHFITFQYTVYKINWYP